MCIRASIYSVDTWHHWLTVGKLCVLVLRTCIGWTPFFVTSILNLTMQMFWWYLRSLQQRHSMPAISSIWFGYFWFFTAITIIDIGVNDYRWIFCVVHQKWFGLAPFDHQMWIKIHLVSSWLWLHLLNGIIYWPYSPRNIYMNVLTHAYIEIGHIGLIKLYIKFANKLVFTRWSWLHRELVWLHWCYHKHSNCGIGYEFYVLIWTYTLVCWQLSCSGRASKYKHRGQLFGKKHTPGMLTNASYIHRYVNIYFKYITNVYLGIFTYYFVFMLVGT